MPSALIHPPKSMLEIWETLPEGTLCQLINNKLVMSPSPVDIHQVILNKINIAISLYLLKKNMGEIRIAPYDVHFSKETILQPDIVFIKSGNLRKIKSRGLFGVPDLVIEILSPSTSQLYLGEKKLIYEKYGVEEYFLVDPNSKSVTSFISKHKKFEEQQKTKAIIKSTLLKAEIKF